MFCRNGAFQGFHFNHFKDEYDVGKANSAAVMTEM